MNPTAAQRLVAWAALSAHLIDMGGMAMGDHHSHGDDDDD